jgi:chromosome segregation protein
LEFADGTTSLLGPNGCGKSNIVDAIKWVLGEQSTKTLRAGKMEDVIFNGTESRKPLHVAEVTLVVDNAEGILPVAHSEVEIKRRLFRSGESEFYINREPVRLRDIRELFFDTGVGKSAYSILEQGKIDQILSTKPEDRRYIFEEAAGITRYKLRSQEAARKLERTEENIEQVGTLLGEIKRQYDSRKAQAAKVERYRELEREQSAMEVDVQLSTIKSFLLLADERTRQLGEAQASYAALKDEIAFETELLETEQATIREHAERRIAIQGRLQRLEEQLHAKREQLELLQQRYRDFMRAKEEARMRADHISDRLERDRDALAEQHDRAAMLAESLEEARRKESEHRQHMEAAQQQIMDHEQEIARHEHALLSEEETQKLLAKRLQELTDLMVGELDQRLSESGYSSQARKKAQELLTTKLRRIKSSLANRQLFSQNVHAMAVDGSTDPLEALQRWDRLNEELEHAFDELQVLFDAYEKTIPSFLDDLLAPEGIITKKHAIDRDMSESRQRTQDHRAAMHTLREETRGLQVLLEQYRERATQLKVALGELAERHAATKSLIETLERQDREQQYLLMDAQRDEQVAQERVQEAIGQMADVKDEQQRIASEQESLEGRLEEVVSLIETENDRLGAKRQQVNERYARLSELRGAIDKYGFHLESINEQIQGVYRTYFDAYGKSLKEYEGRLGQPLDDVGSLRERLAQVKKQIQGMGYINHMAQEEFAEIKERYDFLDQQMADLVKAKNDLTRVIEEIRTRSQELFLDSYHKIRVNFQEMFHRMFGGGRAELRLLDPDQVLESGIDILAQPPGKKLDRLAPLSGGEKSLTAVALLFATYKVKPSPFCILDEIDAALDDRNIGYFLSVLEDFSATSQFIIITHNKHTVMGSKTLLGVTMQERGVSKAISYRMGWEADRDVIHDAQVDIGFDNTV